MRDLRIDIKLRLKDSAALDASRPLIAELARSHVDGAGSLWREVIAGSVQLY